MFLQRLKRMSFRRSSCIVLGVLCSAVVFTSLLHFGSEKFSSKFRTFNGMYFKESSKDGQPLKFPHLQPLRDMFANLTIMKPSKSECMVASAEFSDLKELEKKIAVFLLIVVSTAPSRQDRREAIRQTWGRKCSGEVACKFFTDGIQISKEDQQNLLQEKQMNKDLEFQPVNGGRTFGLRYLYQMMWAAAKYDFKYYLRIDDDYFVCLERLQHELRHRPTKMLSWGSYHCHNKLVYVDEAWTLFTHDVIVRILSQDPQRMLCHPHADQELPIWMDSVFNETEDVTHFDDKRLYHYPPARTVDSFKNLANACDSHMGIHGSSPELMHIFWNSSSDNAKEVTAITEISATCKRPFIFDITFMALPYKFDLRPCIQNPQWTPGETMWGGILSGGKQGTLPCS